MNVTDHRRKYVSPLLCWDIFSEYYHQLLRTATVEYDFKEMKSVLKVPLEISLREVLMDKEYDALVVTDPHQRIEWVSRGFNQMTGYSKSYALGKTPHFLQGPGTSWKTRESIRERLEGQGFFTESVLNYRKNGEEYLCEIKILPLFNKDQELTHYLAIERELSAA